jgi:hypothetical protein
MIRSGSGAEATPSSSHERPSIVRAAWPWVQMVRSTVSDDIRGRIYRIEYRGGADFNAAMVTPCPSAAGPAGNIVATAARPPEGTDPNAGAADARSLPVPEGATREVVQLGERVFRGQVGGAAWTGCHGDSGQGTPLGPPLTRQEMVVERRKLCRDQENNHRWRFAAKRMSQSGATDGRRTAYARPVTSGDSIRLEFKPSGHVQAMKVASSSVPGILWKY